MVSDGVTQGGEDGGSVPPVEAGVVGSPDAGTVTGLGPDDESAQPAEDDESA